MGAEPGARVCPEMVYAEEGLAVMGCEPIVRTGACAGVFAEAGGRGEGVPFTMIEDADEGREYVVPETVIAEEPGASV